MSCLGIYLQAGSCQSVQRLLGTVQSLKQAIICIVTPFITNAELKASHALLTGLTYVKTLPFVFQYTDLRRLSAGRWTHPM